MRVLPFRLVHVRAAVSPVIGTILMVAITVVLAAVVWIMVSGMLVAPEAKSITLNIKQPSVTAAETARYSTTPLPVVFDAVMDIEKVSPNEERVLWTEVTLTIKSSTGSLLKGASALRPDGSLPYDTDADGSIDVEIWYIETTTGDSKVSASDCVKVTGLSTGGASPSYESASIELFKGGERIGSVELPSDFD